MQLSYISFLIPFAAMFLISCEDQKNIERPFEFPPLTVIDVDKLETLPIEESVILAQPIYLTKFDDGSFIVFDSGVSKYFRFNINGKKIEEFGKAGRGPGEYDSFSGLSDLQRVNDKLMGVNTDQYLISTYDLNGDFLVSYDHEKTMKFNNVDFIDDNMMIQATNGAENSLAIIRKLDTGDIYKRIGTPVGRYQLEMNIEEKRKIYAKGEIPSNAINTALVKNTEEGYILFMEALGELRFYSNDGTLKNTSYFPDSLKKPLQELVFKANADGKQGRVMELSYARYLKVFQDKIFLFIPDFDIQEDKFNTKLLISDFSGNFIEYIEFKNSDNYRYFSDFTVTESDTIILIDAINSEIVHYPNN